MRAKSNSPSPAQRQVKARPPRTTFLSVTLFLQSFDLVLTSICPYLVKQRRKNRVLRPKTMFRRKVMKKTIISFTISTFLVIHGFADDIQLPHITVYGTATTEVVPDQMIWSVRVQNRGAVLETVASDHAKNLQGTLSLLKDLKVD